MGRRGLTGRSDRYLFTDNRLRLHSFPNVLPQAKNLLCGRPFGSELRNPKPGAERILMVIALNDIRERQNSGPVQRCRGLAKAIAAGRRLIEDERKWFAKICERRQAWAVSPRCRPDSAVLGSGTCRIS